VVCWRQCVSSMSLLRTSCVCVCVRACVRAHTQHAKFLRALEDLVNLSNGNDWAAIAQAVGRSEADVKRHAQHYFLKLEHERSVPEENYVPVPARRLPPRPPTLLLLAYRPCACQSLIWVAASRCCASGCQCVCTRGGAMGSSI